MSDPKLNALIFCKKVVLTEPWWNLVGVFDELLVQEGEAAEFEAFVKVGNATVNADFQVGLEIVDPASEEVLAHAAALSRGDQNGVAMRALGLELSFPREAV